MTVLRARTRRTSDSLAVCQDCEARLTNDNWTPSMQKYRRYICAPCWSKRQAGYEKKRRETKPDHLEMRRERVRARKSEWSPERRERERRRRYNWWLIRNYGIDIDQYDAMFHAQGGGCAICETKEPKGRGTFHVDHCHESGRVRGLLCTECNMALGLFKDKGDLLMKAHKYLSDTKQDATTAAGGKAY